MDENTALLTGGTAVLDAPERSVDGYDFLDPFDVSDSPREASSNEVCEFGTL